MLKVWWSYGLIVIWAILLFHKEDYKLASNKKLPLINLALLPSSNWLQCCSVSGNPLFCNVRHFIIFFENWKRLVESWKKIYTQFCIQGFANELKTQHDASGKSRFVLLCSLQAHSFFLKKKKDLHNYNYKHQWHITPQFSLHPYTVRC